MVGKKTTEQFIQEARNTHGDMYGFPIDAVFDEVHQANMSKTFPDGTFHLIEVAPGIKKVGKPPGFHPPNVRAVIEKISK